MIHNSQKTIYGLLISSALEYGKHYVPDNNTTLNEKYGESIVEPPENEYPMARYIAIGTGVDDIDISSLRYSNHSSTDAALFNQIPFLAIEKSTDEAGGGFQEGYGLRVIEEIDGVDYAIYYLKEISSDDIRDSVYQVSDDNGNKTISRFNTASSDYLNPTPLDKEAIIASTEPLDYVLHVNKHIFRLTTTEKESINQYMTLKNNGTLPSFSLKEIAVCAGIKALDNATGIEHAENVQITHHVGVTLDSVILTDYSEDYVRTIDIGGVEPLL